MRSLSMIAALGSLAVACGGAEISISGIDLGRPMIAVTAPADGRVDPATAARLQLRVTVWWEEVPLAEVAEHLHRLAGLNVVVAPGVAHRPVTLRLEETRLQAVLDWVATQAGVHRRYRNEAIWFTDEPQSGPSQTRYYDVADLVAPLRSFPGPRLQLESGGRGGLLVPAVAPEAVARTDLDELVDLLDDLVHR